MCVCVSMTSAGVDLIAAFYGCLYAGVIPVTVRPPHPQNLAATLPTVRMIIDVSQNTGLLLSDAHVTACFISDILKEPMKVIH